MFGRKANLLTDREATFKSKIFLLISIGVFFASLTLIFLDNLDILTPNYVIGDKENSNTMMIFLIGIFISIVLVPILYLSSYFKFKRGDDYWEKEVFWILPLSFFGIFFQYLSPSGYAGTTIPFSLMVVVVVHLWLMVISGKIAGSDPETVNAPKYFSSFAYLTAYYLLLTGAVIYFDLFEKMHNWI